MLHGIRLAFAKVDVNQLLVSRLLNLRSNAGMDMNEVRRQNLRRLIDEKFSGRDADFARFCGIEPARISQVLSLKVNVVLFIEIGIFILR